VKDVRQVLQQEGPTPGSEQLAQTVANTEKRLHDAKLSATEWIILEQLVGLLERPAEITAQFEGESFPTLARAYLEVLRVSKKLAVPLSNEEEDAVTQVFARDIEEHTNPTVQLSSTDGSLAGYAPLAPVRDGSSDVLDDLDGEVRALTAQRDAAGASAKDPDLPTKVRADYQVTDLHRSRTLLTCAL